MAPSVTSSSAVDGSSASSVPSGGSALTSSALSTPNPSSANLTSHEDAQALYTSLKAQLQDTLRKKRHMDRTLSDLESQIWLFEGSYFTSTAASGGNIVKGFENYLKGGPAPSALSETVANEDRVFSASSLTYQRSLELKAAEELMKQQQQQKDASKKEKEKDKEKDKDKEEGGSGSGSSKKDKEKGNHKRRRDE